MPCQVFFSFNFKAIVHSYSLFEPVVERPVQLRGVKLVRVRAHSTNRDGSQVSCNRLLLRFL
jgi:hypothetical protein